MERIVSGLDSNQYRAFLSKLVDDLLETWNKWKLKRRAAARRPRGDGNGVWIHWNEIRDEDIKRRRPAN